MKRMLVVRPFRETCLAFYNKFDQFKIDYVIVGSSFRSSVKLRSNVKLHYRKIYGLGSSHNLSLGRLKRVEDLVKKCDVVNLSDTYYSYNYQLIRLAKKHKKPVATVVWKNIDHPVSSWLPPYSWFTKAVVDKTDLFILRNRSAYRFMDSLGIDRKKTVMIYKGVDLNHFHSKENTDSRDKTRILFVGAYIKSKGVVDLINAVERLVGKGLTIELMMAGKGPLNEYINNKKKTLPITNLGMVSYSKIAEVYRSADVFCLPSRQVKLGRWIVMEEYFAYVLMEAMASGLAVVTTDLAGLVEEVGSNNLLVESNNQNQLVKALEKFVREKSARECLGKKNRQRAEQLFSGQKQAKKTEIAILKIC